MNNISAYPKRPRTSLQVNQDAPTVFFEIWISRQVGKKRTSGRVRKCWIVKNVFLPCFYCGEMMILNMVDFSGIKKQPQNAWRMMGPSLENAMTVAFLVRPCLRMCFPAHAMALPSAWAKSLLPLDRWPAPLPHLYLLWLQLKKTMYLRSIKHVSKINTRSITKKHATSVRHMCKCKTKKRCPIQKPK